MVRDVLPSLPESLPCPVTNSNLNNSGNVSDYALLVNDDRTVLVRIWQDGTTEVATRPNPDAIWGPPVAVQPEGDA